MNLRVSSQLEPLLSAATLIVQLLLHNELLAPGPGGAELQPVARFSFREISEGGRGRLCWSDDLTLTCLKR